MIISQQKTSFLGVVFDVDHDCEGPRAPKAHLDTVKYKPVESPAPSPVEQDAEAVAQRTSFQRERGSRRAWAWCHLDVALWPRTTRRSCQGERAVTSEGNALRGVWRDAEDYLLRPGRRQLGLAQRMELLVLISICASGLR